MSRIVLLLALLSFVYIVYAKDRWRPKSQLFQKYNAKTEQLSSDTDELIREQLPRVVNVNRYELKIWPYFPFDGLTTERQDLTFDGTMTVKFTITNDTQSIWLFAQDLLKIKTVQLKYNSESVPISFFDIDTKTTRVTIRAVDILRIGQQYSLTIEYEGPINEYGNAGLYYTTYMNSTQDLKYIVGTFFEPMRSRKMFPNFDDPYFKAVFQLTVIYPNGAQIYSNVDGGDARPYNEKYKIIDFLDTKPMSSYLLAFTIGEFRSSMALTKRGIPVRTISISELSKYLPESAQIGANCVDAMESLVGVKYPLSKLDNIEMLEMGHSSAMENFGLIVYTRFLSQLPIATPAPNRVSQSTIMCHETSHQWFGNLVTAERWGFEFLHESFASYFQSRATQQFRINDIDFIENIMVWEKNFGFYAQENGRHAVSADRAYFDDITYEGGGSMLRMVERVLGSADFFKALNTYLNKYQYASANDDSLISEFEAVKGGYLCGNLTIRQVMKDFFQQPEYPVVVVFIDGSYYGFSQFASGVSDSTWNIPIFALNLRTNEETVGYLLPDGSTCPQNWLLASDPYIFNSKSTTFARFYYTNEVFNEILNVDTSKVDETTLLGLILDEFAFENTEVIQGDLDDEIRNGWRSMQLFKKIAKDRNYTVASHILEIAVIKFLEVLPFFSSRDDSQDLFMLAVKHEFNSVYKTLDWNSSDWQTGHRNNVLLPVAVRYDIADSRDKGRALFNQFKSDCSSLNKLETCNKIVADSRMASYCAGVIDNNDNNIEFLQNYWEKLITTEKTLFYFQYEIDSVLGGLSCVTDEVHLQNLMDVALENDQPKLFDALAMNSQAGHKLKAYIEASVDRFKLHLPLLQNALQAMIATWHTQEDMDTLNNLIQKIQGKFPSSANSYFEEAKNQLNASIFYANLIVPQYVRWIYDNEVPIGKPAWTKEIDVNAKNINYNLIFDPHYPVPNYDTDANQDYTFDGHVIIKYTNTKLTSTITINSHRHLFKYLNVTYETTKINEITVVRTDRDYENGIVTLYLMKQIPVNASVTIEITYLGLLFNRGETDQQGVAVIAYYNNKMDEENFILITELAGGANPRSLVPCFDEPRYKATWDISVVHPTIYTVLSNGAIKNVTSSKQGYSITSFTQTKPMSSYLVAIAIGKFASVSGVTSTGIPVRVWSNLGYEVYGQVALQAAIQTIDYLSVELGKDYANFNSKLDILASLSYAGAMENWGFIIGKENYVLFNEDVQTLEEKQQVYAVVAHETVHHWFGDLVTTIDWANTFVNEAFATYFESEIYNKYNQFGNKIQFISSENALRYDERVKARIIPDNVSDSGFEPFSPIVYDKPSSVLHTLQSVVGEDVFKAGLKSYISDLQFNNADDRLLWSHITRAAKTKNIRDWNGKQLDVQKFMDPFFKQASYPILEVKSGKEGEYYRISQFSYYNTSSLPPSDYNYIWYVPIVWPQYRNDVQWIVSDDYIPDIVIPNPIRQTYTRVKYASNTWSQILKNLKTPNYYNETFRAALITDAYSLVNSGRFEWSDLLNLLKTLKYDNHEIPWKYAAEIFDDLFSRLKFSPLIRSKLRGLLVEAINDRGDMSYSVPWNDINANNQISQLAARWQVGKFVGVASKYMNDYGKKCLDSEYGITDCLRQMLRPESQAAFLCSGLQSNPDYIKNYINIFDYFAGIEQDAFLLAKVNPHIEAVSCLQKAQYINQYLTYIDSYSMFGDEFIKRIGHLDKSGMIFYNWLMSSKDNVSYIQQSSHFAAFVNAMVKDWSTTELLDQYNKIQWNALSRPQQRIIRLAAGIIQNNINWQSKNYDAIAKWLNKNY